MNYFYENILFIPIIAFCVTVFLKGLLIYISTSKWNINKAFGAGGMPSVHSSVVVSLTTAIAIKYGVLSDIFALSLTFSSIIIYDAINIRFEAGKHAKAINESLGEKKYNESLGHLPSEAFAGSVLGILLAVIFSIY